MSDFMKWLYIHYIKPQLDAAKPGEYEMYISILENNLTEDVRADYEKVREFTALEAFQLGFRTGRGLSG